MHNRFQMKMCRALKHILDIQIYKIDVFCNEKNTKGLASGNPRNFSVFRFPCYDEEGSMYEFFLTCSIPDHATACDHAQKILDKYKVWLTKYHKIYPPKKTNTTFVSDALVQELKTQLTKEINNGSVV